MTVYEKAAQDVARHPLFVTAVFEHLDTGVKNIIESTIGLMGNIARFVPEMHKQPARPDPEPLPDVPDNFAGPD